MATNKTMTTSSGNWVLPLDTKEATINTGYTFVDKDIKISVNTASYDSCITKSSNASNVPFVNTAGWADTGYLAGVTINPPASGTRTFSITIPNGASGTVTLTFNVDSNRNVWVD